MYVQDHPDRLMCFCIFYPPVAKALSCYSCASTGPNSKCLNDHKGLVNASTQWQNGTIVPGGMVKDCSLTNPSWKFCMILFREQNGWCLIINDFHYIITFYRMPFHISVYVCLINLLLYPHITNYKAKNP